MRLTWGVFAALAATAVAAAPSFGAGTAPGKPGERSNWTNADKTAFGTAVEPRSKVWFTVERGSLTEVFYPRLDVPNVRTLQFVVAGKGWAERERAATTWRVEPSGRSLAYTLVNRDRQGRYRISKTLVTDPARASVLIRVRFDVLRGGPLRLFALYDPSLDNSVMGDRARGRAVLRARDGDVASALVASVPFGLTSSGFFGRSDGWQDLRADGELDHTYRRAIGGNVVQTAQIGSGSHQSLTFTLALGFGSSGDEAADAARAALGKGFRDRAAAYRQGWRTYLAGLRRAPASTKGNEFLKRQYHMSAMQLRAHEDKTDRGAYVASPSVPWRWESPQLTDTPRGDTAVYHMVWGRDLYQIGTGLIATGDVDGAKRAVRWLFSRQQLPDGHFPQNSWTDGEEFWDAVQMDQVALPIVLAWQLGPAVSSRYWEGIRAGADFIVATGPSTASDRWENAQGYSPGTIAAQIAGLVCAAEVAQAEGDAMRAAQYLATADDWAMQVDSWTYTTTGPLGPGSYYERIDDNGDPNDGHTIELSDGGGAHDERAIVDATFLELVRLGIKAPGDSHITSTLQVIDDELRAETPNGAFWHRYQFDGYGEFDDGRPWFFDGEGRVWPLLAGERGEYAVAAGRSGLRHLRAMARAANAGRPIPEQVWDEAGNPTRWGFQMGEGTLSATPLAWAHAQYVRLAQSIDAGRPVEQPEVVACRYAGC